MMGRRGAGAAELLELLAALGGEGFLEIYGQLVIFWRNDEGRDLGAWMLREGDGLSDGFYAAEKGGQAMVGSRIGNGQGVSEYLSR